MSTVRIWAVKSHHDAKAVKRLANKWVTDLQLGNLSIQTTDKKAFLKRNRKNDSLGDTLRRATQHYLQQDDCVIFVIDRNSPMSTHQRQQKSDLLITGTEQILKESHFAGKVFLAQGVQELKAWLPIVYKFLEEGSTTWREEWDSAIAPFHKAFADTPEDEVARDLDEALAEVRHERT